MIPKVLVICGPTATGKTQLSFLLAKKFNGEIISADSRQVYKYMDIGTGKDKPEDDSIKIWGYDLVSPNEQFSISHYQKFAKEKIEEIQKRNHLPILVGGSGLYIKAATEGIETASIKPDTVLRENLKDKTVEELVKILNNADALRLQKMNMSDRNNPRRLIRAIEIAESTEERINEVKGYDLLFIGLTFSLTELEKKISVRVDERVRNGFQEEIKFLKENNYWSGAPSVTLGYKQSLSAGTDKDWISKWKLEEFKYAKRQITWFKKDKRINWFDVTDKNYEERVEKLVEKWYAQRNAKED